MDILGDNHGENQDGWYRQNMQENGQDKEFWIVFTTNSVYFDPSKFQELATIILNKGSFFRFCP